MCSASLDLIVIDLNAVYNCEDNTSCSIRTTTKMQSYRHIVDANTFLKEKNPERFDNVNMGNCLIFLTSLIYGWYFHLKNSSYALVTEKREINCSGLVFNKINEDDNDANNFLQTSVNKFAFNQSHAQRKHWKRAIFKRLPSYINNSLMDSWLDATTFSSIRFSAWNIIYPLRQWH